MLFSDIAGQQMAKKGLTDMWLHNHLPHALLLAGPQGTGSLPLALALAQYIFCENKQSNDACGQCPNCGKVARLEHADLHLCFPTISPKSGTKAMSKYYLKEFREFVAQTPYGSTFEWLQFINAENKQGNITAEECREIIEALNLKSYEGGKKVLLMWRPEYLGKEGNILLKMIEEPPAETIIIMAAEQTDTILPTILSRTQLIRLAPLKPEEIADELVQQSGVDAGRALQIAHISGGSFSEALHLLRNSDNDMFVHLRNWFNSLFTNNGINLSKFADDLSKTGREQQKNFLRYVLQMLENAIRTRYTGKTNLPGEEGVFVQKLAASPLSLEGLYKMAEAITDTIYHIERNAHVKIQLHALSLRMVYAIQNKQVNSHVN